MDDIQVKVAEKARPHPNYLLVFIVLAVITAMITGVELLANQIVPRPLLNIFFITMSVIKATLVAMFYMHLKHDSRLYTVLFGLPVLFAVFLLVMLLI